MKALLFALFVSGALTTYSVIAAEVGVFYYPGWNRPNVDGWAKIKPYPEREPLLGWYEEGADEVTKTQIGWLEKYGINFVAYDWYWDQGSGVKNRTYAIDSFIRNSKDASVDFTILWANHTGTPISYEQFDEIVSYWIKNYFTRNNYKTIDGEPVVFVFSPELLFKDSKKFGSSPKELLNRARAAARQAGLKGIYFVGSAKADIKSVSVELPDQSYDALSAYNYQNSSSSDLGSRSLSASYRELSDGYAKNWQVILENSKIPYILPLTSGWDKTPWGGSFSPAHDNSISTPATFAEHLMDAKKLLLKSPDRTLNTVVICCWNEYGEGSYIEPTKKFGYKYLEKIKEVLK
jgi:hypothetical protein